MEVISYSIQKVFYICSQINVIYHDKTNLTGHLRIYNILKYIISLWNLLDNKKHLPLFLLYHIVHLIIIPNVWPPSMKNAQVLRYQRDVRGQWSMSLVNIHVENFNGRDNWPLSRYSQNHSSLSCRFYPKNARLIYYHERH